jgi:hypothetical protein
MRIILLGLFPALCATASVVTTVECEFADIATGTVLSTECEGGVYGFVQVNPDETRISVVFPGTSLGNSFENLGILWANNSVDPDYFDTVSLSAAVTMQWRVEERYVITGGSGAGTVRGTYGQACDFEPQTGAPTTVTSMRIATNFASFSFNSECPDGFGAPFEYPFTFGEPVTFFGEGEIGLTIFRERNPFIAFYGSAAILGSVDGVFDSAGQPVDATFTLIPEPGPAWLGVAQLVFAGAALALRRRR